MKKLMIAISFAILMTATGIAGTITVNDGPGNPGGIFNVVTSNNGSFQTFCLEHTEYLSIGATYFYEVSNAAKYNNIPGNSDPISRATAYLFANFRSYTGYANDATYNNAIQNAIWYFEGESYSGSALFNLVVAWAKANAGANWADDANGAFGVYVMNLNQFAKPTFEGRVQDLLLVPDGGLTLMLLGIGVGGLALLSRRRRD